MTITPPNQSSGKERRTHDRADCELAIEFYTDQHEFTECLSNISAGGAFIETSRPLKKGEELTLAVPYGRLETDLEFTCEVVRVTEEGIGVRFQELSPYQERLIVDFVKTLKGVKDVRPS